MNVAEVQVQQELFMSFIFLLQLAEKLLRVAASLGARPRADMVLDVLPLLAVQLESLQEAEVLVARPPALLESSFLLCWL